MFGRLLPLFALALGLFLAPKAAEAKGIAIFNWGEDVFETGPIPEGLPQEEGWKAGYKCNVAGLFWAYFHKWDCEAVAFKQDSFNSFTYDNSPEVKAILEAKYKPEDIKMGFWAQHGRWVFLAGFVLLFGGGIVLDRLKKRGGGNADYNPEA